MKGIRGTLAAIAVCAGALLAAPSAGAVERVAHGDFDATICNPGCANPSWFADTQAGAGSVIGPLCGSNVLACNTGVDGYHSAEDIHWALLGVSYPASEDRPPPFHTAVEQDVVVPEPGTLSFYLMIVDRPGISVGFNVRLGGQVVYSAADGDAFVSPHYTHATIPVPAMGSEPVSLRFEAAGEASPSGTAFLTDTFNVDEVSLDAPDPPALPGGPGTAGPNGSTGQRAAALKKCKRKHGRKRKKCRRRALRLPV